MIDDVVIERYMRDADPIPNTGDLDADEFARFVAAADARRAAVMEAPSQHPTRPTPAPPPSRRRLVWVFALAFIVALVGIGMTFLVLRGEEAPVAGQPTSPTTLLEGAAAHLEPTRLQLGAVAGFSRSGDTLSVWDGAGGIAGYRDGVWQSYPALPSRAFDVAGTSSGAVWALTGDPYSSALWYLDEAAWRQLPLEPQTELEMVEVDESTGIVWLATAGSLHRWDGVEMTSAGSPPRGMVMDEVAVTGDGTVWGSRFNPFFPESGGLVRYHDDTGTWESIRPLGGDRDVHAALAPTPNGNLWVLLGDFRVPEEPPPTGALAYFDGTSGEWTIHRMPEEALGDLVADDEGLWWASLGIEGLAGVVRFDGQTRTTYLPQLVVDELGIGADGTLWVSMPGETGTVYRLVIDEAIGGNDAATTTGSPETAGTGTITISVQDWSGMEGYRLLAGVWDGYDIVGGAFWTLIDRDPFSSEDVVHPPSLGEDGPDDFESWGAGDYVWEETAKLEPGTYQIHLWANPGELTPYGNLVPANPIERTCWIDVQVIAGEASKVVITDIPVGDGPCHVADS